MLPFMHGDLMELVRDLLKHFIKSRVIESCVSGFDLTKIDMNKTENHIKTKDIFVGFSGQNRLQDLKRSGEVIGTKVSQFKEECRSFYSTMLAKLFERLPLRSSIIRNSRILDPKTMIESSHESNERCMKNLV